jgi:predicted GH43/DUF377 family glycosyl hydrolase
VPTDAATRRRILGESILQHHDHAMLRPDPARTIARPFLPGWPGDHPAGGPARSEVIINRILTLDDAGIDEQLEAIKQSLDERHRDIDDMLRRRFDEVAGLCPDPAGLDDRRRRLIGGYFTEEYAFEAAALFNPSVVLHPDQEGAPEGSLRFVMSLRGIGEGHVSSVSYRTGLWTPGGSLELDPLGKITQPPIVEETKEDSSGRTCVRLRFGECQSISETVLSPVLPTQRQGIEDLRLVRFTDDDGSVTYYGTYTAFSGAEAQSELLIGTGFHSFAMHAMSGDAVKAKGMALFPRKIGGQYVMLGRQDNENIWLLTSDDILTWNGGAKLIEPRYAWEFVQVGNCGSPIEIDEGWLVLTHGVGTVRNYSIGACLLDRDDPSRVIARTPKPILQPSPDERDGYVPNVVYSCGAMAHGRDLLLPFGVADSFTAFATAKIDDLLAVME